MGFFSKLLSTLNVESYLHKIVKSTGEFKDAYFRNTESYNLPIWYTQKHSKHLGNSNLFLNTFLSRSDLLLQASQDICSASQKIIASCYLNMEQYVSSYI